MAKVFFSYSHKDEELRDELEIHLSAMKRLGVIDTWHDRRIESGRDFGGSISENIEDSDVILLLVSPYFLSSDYCYDTEMTRAMEKHHEGSARVIPVILHPCDWHDTPFSGLLALPVDGKPVSKYSNLHDAFLEITQGIKSAVKTTATSEGTPKVVPTAKVAKKEAAQRSSNLRVKKSYTEKDRDDFLENSFDYIANYFEESLAELASRNDNIDCKFKRINAESFISKIYNNDRKVSECKIFLGGFSGGITFSFDASSDGNSFNESMTVQEDGYSLTFSAMGMGSLMQRGSANGLTQQGAAEYYWSMLIERLQ